jgi:hypothetical protein
MLITIGQQSYWRNSLWRPIYISGALVMTEFVSFKGLILATIYKNLSAKQNYWNPYDAN